MLLSPKRSLSSALLTLAVLAADPVSATAGAAVVVEVFSATDVPVDTRLHRAEIDVLVEVYELDGIRELEAELSRGLRPDAEAARRVALARVGRLNEGRRQQLRRTALGLSKAMQYCVDRYPAIVFDGQAVVYGLTDLEQALRQYRQWQRASAR